MSGIVAARQMRHCCLAHENSHENSHQDAHENARAGADIEPGLPETKKAVTCADEQTPWRASARMP
jgi:hypothetical protein